MQTTKIDLSKKASFGIGGEATVFYPKNISDVIWCKEAYPDIVVLGGATKVLLNDRCNDLIVMDMSKFSSKIKIRDRYVDVDAGVKTFYLINYLAEQNYSGLEFLYGIPGLIGGAVVMNAGSVGRGIEEAVERVVVVTNNGDKVSLTNDALHFGRRYSILQDKKWVVTSVTLRVFKDNKYSIEDKIDFYKLRRKDFPNEKSAGGVFVEHHKLLAYKLDGLSCGDACLKGNFILNKGNATAQDVLQLINVVRSTVKEDLKLELKLVGF